jgi:hypothetical protein
MVVHGCQQSSELLALSGRPEGGCIHFRIEPTATIQCHTNSWALFRTRVSHVIVSNAFRKPQEVLNAHRLDYSCRERTDSYAIAYQRALLNPSQRSQISQIDTINENVGLSNRAGARVRVTVLGTMRCCQYCPLHLASRTEPRSACMCTASV